MGFTGLARAAADTSSTAWPSQLTPRDEVPVVLSHENAALHLNTTIWLLVGFSASFLGLRLYCKFLRHRGFWWDDYILIGAWVRSP
jgi:hypothetical protein